MLTLRDAQSQKTHLIPPGGAVVGREGGDADITVQDRSVSKKHAKIYARNGGWIIEDLNSANGTFVDDQRISGPTPIGPGTAISLSSYQFQVLKVASAAAAGGTSSASQELDGDNELDPGVRTKMARNPYDEGSRGSGSGRSAPSRIAPSARASAPQADGGEMEAPEAKGFGEVMAILPKAVAHYMVGVPKLLFNPLGTVRDSAENQTFAAMGKMELIAWALPALLTQAVLGLVCSVIAGLIAGSPIGSVISAAITGVIGGAIGAVVGAIVAGFIYHWLLELIVRLLKGSSDAVSRSNYFVIVMTAAILVMVPSALAILFAGIAARGGFLAYFMVFPPLLAAVGSALNLFVAYTWFKNVFQTARWTHIVLLILLVLAPIQGVLGAVSAISAASHVASAGHISGGTGGVKVTVPATGGHAGGTVTVATPFAVQTPVVSGTRVAVAVVNTPSSHSVTGAAGTAGTGGSVPSTGGGDEEGGVSAPANGGAMTDYQRYVARRDEIERRIAADPTILLDPRQAQVKALYARLHLVMGEARKRVTHGRPVAPDDALTQHLVEAETFQQTRGLVEDLHKALFGR